MGIYILKFSACLFSFWLLYVLVFEKQSANLFKRFYLLSALVVSIIIPSITFTKYIDQEVTQNNTSIDLNTENIFQSETNQLFTIENIVLILWIIYGIGFLLFSIRFILNLYKIKTAIKANHNFTKQSFVYVLMDTYKIPHSFFNYIFLNKEEYKNSLIPEEVILHEEAHSNQWHSLDIIFIELLLIIFWFHPLIYKFKNHIKLNHEFLADQAVISQGVSASKYQHLLLQLSSYTGHYQLASTFNYSLIKKRFTVMKSNTSKTRIWVSSFLLIPVIALLLFNFSEHKTVNMNKETQSEVTVKNQDVFKPVVSETMFQEKVTKKQLAEYNAWAKPYNAVLNQKGKKNKNFPMVKQKEVEHYKYIYNLMTDAQKKSAQPFPNFPPPPPPPPPSKIKETKPKKVNKKSKAVKISKTKKADLKTKTKKAVPPPPPKTTKPLKEKVTSKSK